MAGPAHSHSDEFSRATHRHGEIPNWSNRTRPFYIAIALNLTLFVSTLVAGIITGSLTLVGNAIHVLSDVAGLMIGIIASWLASRPASIRHSFGLVRMEVLGALATTLMLAGVAVFIFYQGVLSLGTNSASAVHDSVQLTLFGILGVVISVLSAFIFASGNAETLMSKANILHFVSDALGWIFAIAAGLALRYLGLTHADAIASILIALIILIGSIKIVASIVNILLDSAPSAQSVKSIEEMLLSTSGIQEVHHLHVWRLTSSKVTLSAHLVMSEGTTLHDAQQISIGIKERLYHEFEIDHATLELECHLCDSPTHNS